MEKIIKIIGQLADAGIEVYLFEEKLEARAIKGAMTPYFGNLIKNNKLQIIECLNQQIQLQQLNIRPQIVPIERDKQHLVPSYAQQRLWFIDKMDGGSAQYNMYSAMHFKGDFNIATAEAAFRHIISRHEPLRTTFVEGKNGPLQVIKEQFDFSITQIDLCHLSNAAKDTAIKAAVKQDAEKTFDLNSDLMLRVSYLQINTDEGLMLFNIHHIASDGWSMGILFDEFVKLYRSILDGKDNPLIPLKIQYADYAYWQRDWLTGEVLESQLSYWDKQLADLPQVHNLPLDFERPVHNTFNGAAHPFYIDNNTLKQLNAIAQENKASLFMLIHAAFAILLSRYSNSTDIVIGTPVANRLQKELEPLIGFFVNTLVLRADCAKSPSFQEFLKQIKTTNLNAQINQDVSFEHLVDRLKPNRSINHNALFQIMLSMNTSEEVELTLPNVSLKPHKKSQINVKFDLLLKAQPVHKNSSNDTSKGLHFIFEYNTDLFSDKTIKRLAQSMQLLLTGIATDPTQSIAQLPLLGDKEMHYLTQTLNNTHRDYPKHLCIHQLFEKQVKKTPDNIALVCAEQSLTYSEFNEKANQLAHYLIKKGIKPDCLVGLCVERSLEMMIGLMAILKAGGAYLPLDPNYPKDRLLHMVQDSGLSLLLTQHNLANITDKLKRPQLVLDDPQLLSSLSAYSSENPFVAELDSRKLAYVIYTSGSTGLPKGVMVEHQASLNRIDWMQKQYHLTEKDVVLQKTPFSFDVSVCELTWFFTVGARLVMAAPEGHKDPAYLCDVIQKNQVTMIRFVPSMLRVMLTNKDWANCRSLRKIFCTGEAFPIDIPALHYSMNNATLYNLYGPTEAAVEVSHWQVPNTYETGDNSEKDLTVIPIGKPIQNIQLLVLNAQLQVQPKGSPGELFIGGVGLARGYINQPELTAERFIQNSFTEINNQRLYRTGDLVRYLDDGNLAFIGRVDHQVKLHGFRIELGEIDQQLSSCADVNASVTIVREDKPGQKHLVAYFTSDSMAVDSLLIADIKSVLQNHLPDYMLPSLYVRLESMPLNTSGKIDRKALPKPDALSLVEDYIAPVGKVELSLAEIWAELLKIPQESISANANFFEQGGHSLLSIRLLAEVRAVFACELTVREVFENPQLSEFAKQIDRSESHNRPAITTVERKSNQLLPSYAQQRLWFIDQMDGASAQYNIPSAMQLDGDFKVDVAQAAFTEIIKRHETLRTVFIDTADGPLQVINQQFGFSITQIDLSSLSTEAQNITIDDAIKQDAELSFNLSQDLMLRVSYIRTAIDQGVMLFNMHHIASDGWSIGVLIDEFAQLYRSNLENKPSPLSALPIQYADYAHWQRNWLCTEVLESQLRYWDRQLADLPQVHSLPLTHKRPSTQTFNGAELNFCLDNNDLESLKAIALDNQVTLFMLLHAAFSMLLSRYANNTDIIIGTPVANRLQKELEGLIGFFINTLILRVDCSENPSFIEFLKQIKNINLDAQANQDVPFEHLVDRFNPARSTSHSALFQILFSMDTNENKTLELPHVSLSPKQRQKEGHIYSKFELILSASEIPQGLRFSFKYNCDLFDEAIIKRMSDSLLLILKGIATNPKQRLNEFEILDTDQQHYLLHTLNDTQVNYQNTQCIHQLFETQVTNTPNEIALVFAQQQLSYQQLNQLANQLAYKLIERGVKQQTIIGLYTENSVSMIAALLAILKVGAAYLPLDPNQPDKRLNYILNDSQINYLLTNLNTDHLKVKDIHVIKLDEKHIIYKGQASLDNPDVTNDNSQLAYIIYTSGSTGHPKGVMVEHANVMAYHASLLGQWKLLNGHKVSPWLWSSSYAFDASVKGLLSLCAGRGLVVPTKLQTKKPEAIVNLIQKHRIGIYNASPHLMELTLEYLEMDRIDTDNPHYPDLILGGENIPQHVLNKVLAYCKKYQRQALNAYGPTETTINSSFDLISETLTIGKPIANTQAYVLNDNCKLVPFGTTGELYISGAGLSRGYLHRQDLTAERFIQHPFSKDSTSRLYRTGDLVRYIADGRMVFMGRVDEQVKIRGFRIELGEIEHQLSRIKNINSSLVILRENKSGQQQLVAYIVLDSATNEDSKNHINKIKNKLALHLPDYMLPSAFVLLDALPLNANGKTDYHALAAPDESMRQDQYIAPQGDFEQGLCSIWSELLKLPAKRISTTANFFELGGHSLLSVRLVAQIRARFNTEIAIHDIFETPQLSILADVISQNKQVARPQITVMNRKDYKLITSYSQQRLWFIDQMDVGSAHYNIPSAIRLYGDFRLDVAQAAFTEIIRRHETLRTVFIDGSNGPLQIVRKHFDFSIVQKDLSELSSEAHEQAINAAIKQDSQQVFNLSEDLMLRVSYLHISNNEGVMLFNMHHIASDGWSIGILTEEFVKLYRSKLEGTPNLLTPLPIQYVDYAYWQRNWLRGEVLESQLAYWDKQLADLPQVHNLPLDFERPAYQTFNGASFHFNIEDNTLKGLESIAIEQNSTLFMLLHATFSILLSRYSNNSDIVIATPVANRLQQELEGLIGFFVNTLILRTNCSNNPSFIEFLQQVKTINLDAQANQDIPFEHLVDRLNPSRSTSYNPLFQVMLSMNTNENFELTLPKVTIRPQKKVHVTAKSDLVLNVTPINDLKEKGLRCSFTYNTSLFEAKTIERLASSLQRLLEAIVSDETQGIAELPLLDDKETNYLIHTLNDTQVDYPTGLCIHELFEQKVADAPDSLAMVFANHSLSYGQLNTKANQLARYLLEQGTKPDDLIGICIERSMDMIIAILATLKAGAAYLPLDPDYPWDRLKYMLEDSQVELILTQQHLLNDLDIMEQQAVLINDWSLFNNYSAENIDRASIGLKVKHLAYLIYTSGSTGQPKGVMIEHQSVLNLAQFQRRHFSIKPHNSVLQFASINFDAATSEWTMALLSGASLYICDKNTRQDAKLLENYLCAHRLSHVTIPPALLKLMDFERNYAFEALLVAGEDFDQELSKKWGTKYKFYNGYGPTETTVCGSISAPLCEQRLNIGKQMSNSKVYILDAQQRLLPCGVTGELYISGDSLARGYLNQSELTAEKFIANPFSNTPTDRMYRTGDLVRYMDDGNIEFMGRVDHQVKIRGFRIELGEIEFYLAKLAQINSSVVMVEENQSGEKTLSAYVTLKEKHVADENTVDSIKKSLKKSVPAYMIPSFITILEQLPLTQNGKIDLAALSAMAKPVQEQEYIKPANQHEKTMVQVLSKELQIDISTISMGANFFDIGGNSLSLLNIVNKLNANGLPGNIKAFYEYETLREICEASIYQDSAVNDSLIKLNSSIKGTPIYLVHPMGGRADCYKPLAEHLACIAPVYGIQAPFVSNHNFEFNSLIQLAEYYAAAIVANQPVGPYRLGGWSIGGLLAQHIVEVLNKAGKEVEYFIGLDSFMIMPYQQNSSNFAALKRVLAFARKETELDESFLPKDIESKNTEQQLDIAARLLKSEDKSSMSEQQIRYGIKFGISFFKAKISLSPQNISKKSVLFITEENSGKKNMIEGWKKAIHSIHTCDFEYVPGKHLFILAGESSVQIAEKVLSDLNNIDLVIKRD